MGKVVGRPEDDNDHEDRKEEEPVHDIDIDLRSGNWEMYNQPA